ncbi:MAG TPA: TrmH family RNA methyltransferase [Dissulfurispiraceae bacterium]|nr:TrmH family RNA methyltransferase [Dissulfurispiraceae bacterium]
MHAQDWKNNVHFVLVEPRESGNVGASARAIKNMGFQRLSLVCPPDPLGAEARWFARGALDVLDSAERHMTLDSALINVSVVAGTTRRTGRKRGLIVSADEGARRLYDVARQNNVALLFGREDRGLFNEEINQCGFLIHISAHLTKPSLNLGQAVLLVAYELAKVARLVSASAEDSSRRPAVLVSNQEVKFLYERMTNALRLLDYLPRGDRNLEKKIMHNLKHFIGRAGITEWEINMLLGLCSRVETKFGKAGNCFKAE